MEESAAQLLHLVHEEGLCGAHGYVALIQQIPSIFTMRGDERHINK